MPNSTFQKDGDGFTIEINSYTNKVINKKNNQLLKNNFQFF